MIYGKSLKEVAGEQAEILRHMTLPQKIDHIWTNFRVPIVAVLLVVAGIIGTIYSVKLNDYENVFYVAVVDGHLTYDDNEQDPLSSGFTQYLGIDGKTQRVEFDTGYTLTYTNSLDQDPYLSAQKLETRFYAGNTDGFLADYSLINGFSTGTDSSLMDLRDLLSDEELEKISDHLIYLTMDDGSRIPNAVDMQDTKLVNELGLRMDHPCFGIVITSKYSDNGVNFIRYIFDL
jgi:hypothetical protein